MDPVKEEILIVLGSPNSPSGVLGGLAISRLDYCLTQYKKGVKILCTGGWGPHFNVSENSHASYAENYLLDKGVGKEDILKSALSENTVDDAVKSKAILADFPGARLMVITSDFHVERVTLIFAEILKEFEINFVGVESKLDRDLLHSLIAHEKEAIASIRKHGLYY
jgi:hypothetical protein